VCVAPIPTPIDVAHAHRSPKTATGEERLARLWDETPRIAPRLPCSRTWQLYMAQRAASWMAVEYSTSTTSDARSGGITVQTSPQRMKASTKANELESASITRYGRGRTTIAPSTSAGLVAHPKTPTALRSGILWGSVAARGTEAA